MYQILIHSGALPALHSSPTVIATGSDEELRPRIANILRLRKTEDPTPPIRLAPHHYQFANGSRLQMTLAPEAAAAVPSTVAVA